MVADIYICSYQESSVSESFNQDILDYAAQHELGVLDWKDIKRKSSSLIEDKGIWSIICVGWKYLIPSGIMTQVNGRVLVTHDSLLPRYRGYAPLPTALINGDKTVGVSVIIANDEVDAGDILYQKEVSVGANDTINDLIKKLLPFFSEGIVTSLEKIMGDNPERRAQNHEMATYSIWRNEADLIIDWNQSADTVERTIRALGPPYMGARTRLDDDIVIIQKAKVVPELKFEIRQVGKIWKLSQKGEPVVICGKGMLLITGAEINKKSLIPLTKVRQMFH
jgi:methionyl-tRNA formyltransferase